MYKRQTVTGSIVIIGGYFKLDLVQLVDITFIENVFIGAIRTIVPVSSTHLNVYKRQVSAL